MERPDSLLRNLRDNYFHICRFLVHVQSAGIGGLFCVTCHHEIFYPLPFGFAHAGMHLIGQVQHNFKFPCHYYTVRPTGEAFNHKRYDDDSFTSEICLHFKQFLITYLVSAKDLSLLCTRIINEILISWPVIEFIAECRQVEPPNLHRDHNAKTGCFYSLCC